MPINIYDTTFHRHVSYKVWEFPGGEIGVRVDLPSVFGSVQVKADGILKSQDLITCQHIIHALNESGVTNISLFMPYLPYARQDRICHPGENFALKSFISSFFVGLPIKELVVYDLHSNVSLDLLEKVVKSITVIHQHNLVSPILKNYDCLVFPDEGAAKKSFLYHRIQEQATTHFVMSKTRFEGGAVIYTKREEVLTNYKALVVDDICDGGATFIALAQSLVNAPKVLDLYVTHGIFSRGLDTLTTYYNNVYTANLMTSDPQVITSKNLHIL